MQLIDDPKFTKFAFRAGAVLATLVFLTLANTLIWGAVAAGVGILALGGLALAGVAGVALIPYLGQRLENKVLSLRKAEARLNPIEQLQNFLREKQDRVNQFKSAVGQIGAQIRSLADMLEQRKRERPGYDSSRQEKALLAMESAHQTLCGKFKRAEEALRQLEDVIEDKKFEWHFSQAGQSAMRQLNAASGEDLMNQMLADEAFSSVRDNFNQVFAELDLETVRLNETKTLDFDDGMTLDLQSIQIPEYSKSSGGK